MAGTRPSTVPPAVTVPCSSPHFPTFMDFNRIAVALRHCGKVGYLKRGNALHCHLKKVGGLNDVYLGNNLISTYLDFSDFRCAQKVFDEMFDRNIITWTTMVSAYANGGRPYESLRLYDSMPRWEIPNGFMYSAVLKACAIVADIERGKLIHERIFREKMVSDTVLMNSLLDMYIKCGSLSDAQKVFDEILCANTTSWNTLILGYTKSGSMEEAIHLIHSMPEPNAVSWNTIIAGFADRGSVRALELVSMMHRKGFKLDDFTFSSALKACAFHGFSDFGKQIHSYVIKGGLECSYFTLSAVIDMYSNCNLMVEAVKLFDENSTPDASLGGLAIWNSLLSGYIVNNHNRAAFSLISQIYCSGAHLDTYTFSGALKTCINFQNSRVGHQVHGLVVTYGYELDCVVGSIVVDLYAKWGSIENAFKLFERLPKKDAIAWSGLIMGCAQRGLNWLAFSIFRDMITFVIEIDHFVVSSVLKTCSSIASPRSGKQVHAFCVKKGYGMEDVLITSLTDMYAKCGEIQDGLILFNCMPEKDVVSWTGIIVGCGRNGKPEQAIRLFHEMIESGSKPNEVTFLGVLSACRYAGLVEEAKTIFNSMKIEYKLEPYLEHYCCMVDLLGQAGHFDEAQDLIANMPFEPDHNTWRTLLGACGAHQNAELVHVIADHLLETLSEDQSVYVTLSNAYAALGKWYGISKARKAAKTVGVKYAGMSWIEISS